MEEYIHTFVFGALRKYGHRKLPKKLQNSISQEIALRSDGVWQKIQSVDRQIRNDICSSVIIYPELTRDDS